MSPGSRKAVGRQGEPVSGRVFLVGAGPGDPGLLTLRAKQLIESADLIIHDRLVSRDILDFAPDNAELLYVGKVPGHHCVPQPEINQLMAREAKAGRDVVRLKGGDPLIFGRGGEEADFLRTHGVVVEIIPGVTAAQGAAASLAIPLTQRGVNTSVRYITGHLRDEADPDCHAWDGLADSQTTLVVYMGAANIGHFAEQLQRHGRTAATPAIAIASATSAQQSFVRARLDELAEAAERVEFGGPVLFIIGETVGLAQHLDEREQEAHAHLSLAADIIAAQ